MPTGIVVTFKEASHSGGLSDETFRVLVEQAADGIFIATSDGRFVEVNPSGHRMLGYEPPELVGKTIADVLCLREHERLSEVLAASGSGSTLWYRTRRMRSACDDFRSTTTRAARWWRRCATTNRVMQPRLMRTAAPSCRSCGDSWCSS